MKSAKNSVHRLPSLSVDGKEITGSHKRYASVPYTEVIFFNYFGTGNMLIVDSGMNLIGNSLIQGGEKVKSTIR